jgi:hypothetical protein
VRWQVVNLTIGAGDLWRGLAHIGDEGGTGSAICWRRRVLYVLVGYVSDRF